MEDNIVEFDSLLKEQPDVTNSLRGGQYERTLLMKGAIYGDTQIVSLLFKREHDLSVVDVDGDNVFHWIVVNNDNDDDSLGLLNSLDATNISDVINNQNRFKYTPLHLAAWRNMHKSIVWLLEHGANPTLNNIDGKRPDEHDECDDVTKRLIRSFRN